MCVNRKSVTNTSFVKKNTDVDQHLQCHRATQSRKSPNPIRIVVRNLFVLKRTQYDTLHGFNVCFDRVSSEKEYILAPAVNKT